MAHKFYMWFKYSFIIRKYKGIGNCSNCMLLYNLRGYNYILKNLELLVTYKEKDELK